MKNIEPTPIDEPMDFMTFKDVVEQVTGQPFEKIYGEFVLHGEKNEQGNLERP